MATQTAPLPTETSQESSFSSAAGALMGAASGLISEHSYTPDTHYLNEAQHAIIRRMGYGRPIGTYVYSEVEDRSQKSFMVDDQGRPLHEGTWFAATRKIAELFDKGYDAALGKGRKDWELTEKGRKELGLIKSLAGEVTQDHIDAGYFRPRRYGLEKPDVEKLNRIAEIQESIRAADKNGTSGDELAELRDELHKLEHTLSSKNRSWGVQAALLGIGFALMGFADFASDTLMKRLGNAVKSSDKPFDPEWKNSDEAQRVRDGFSSKGLFGIVPAVKGMSSLSKEWAIDLIRGDGLYDLMQVVYPSVKEHYHRQRDGDKRELEYKDGKAHVIKNGSGKSDYAKLFNAPFTFYNWWGKFVWQDLIIDWWLVPKQSRLRNYMAENKIEDVGFFKNIWNTALNFTSFCWTRTAQITSYMYPAAAAGFSGERFYANMATDEIKLVRRFNVLHESVESTLEAAGLSDKFVATDIVQTVLDRINTITGDTSGKSTKQPPVQSHTREGVFSVSHGISAAYKNADKAQIVAEIIAEKTGDASHIEACKKHYQNYEHKFYVDYINGNRPDFHFADERNGEKDANGVEKRTMSDRAGNVLKSYVNFHSAALQTIQSTALKAKGQSPENLSTDELKALINKADYAAASYAAYGPYFTLKDVGSQLMTHNRALNLPISKVADFIKKLRSVPEGYVPPTSDISMGMHTEARHISPHKTPAGTGESLAQTAENLSSMSAEPATLNHTPGDLDPATLRQLAESMPSPSQSIH